MPKIIFKIDLKQDAKNWVRVAHRKKHPFGLNRNIYIQRFNNKDLLKQIIKLPRDKAINVVYKYLQKNSDKFLDELNATKSMLEFYFKHKSKALFKALAKVTGKPIYTSKFFATFTLMSSAPYNPEKDWFMIMAKKPTTRQLTNICHEILHLQFIHYYYDYCVEKGLNQKQFQDLKEAITFLLNEPVFKKLYLAPDNGYPNHVELRKKLKRVWDKDKNFKRFLDKAIKVIKT